jgi:hypothetical protein
MTDSTLKTVSSKTSVFGALDNAPMTFAHYLYWLLASGGTLLDGFSVVSLGIALPLLKRDFAITPTMVGFIGSALVLGAVRRHTPCLTRANEPFALRQLTGRNDAVGPSRRKVISAHMSAIGG